MTFASRDQDRVVRRLIEFAGEPEIFEDALDALRDVSPKGPTIEQLLQKTLELRNERGLGLPTIRTAAAG